MWGADRNVISRYGELSAPQAGFEGLVGLEINGVIETRPRSMVLPHSVFTRRASKGTFKVTVGSYSTWSLSQQPQVTCTAVR